MSKMDICTIVFLSVQLFVAADWIPISDRKDNKISFVKSHKNSRIGNSSFSISNSFSGTLAVFRLQFPKILNPQETIDLMNQFPYSLENQNQKTAFGVYLQSYQKIDFSKLVPRSTLKVDFFH